MKSKSNGSSPGKDDKISAVGMALLSARIDLAYFAKTDVKTPRHRDSLDNLNFS